MNFLLEGLVHFISLVHNRDQLYVTYCGCLGWTSEQRKEKAARATRTLGVPTSTLPAGAETHESVDCLQCLVAHVEDDNV